MKLAAYNCRPSVFCATNWKRTYKIWKFHGFFPELNPFGMSVCLRVRKILGVPIGQRKKKLFRLNHHFLALSFTINFLGIILSAIKVEFFICEWHNAWSCMHAFVWMLAKRVCTSPNGSKKKSTSFDHAIIFTANFSYQIFETVTTAKKPAFVS